MEEKTILVTNFIQQLMELDRQEDVFLKEINQNVRFLNQTFRNQSRKHSEEYIKRMSIENANGWLHIGRKSALRGLVNSLAKDNII